MALMTTAAQAAPPPTGRLATGYHRAIAGNVRRFTQRRLSGCAPTPPRRINRALVVASKSRDSRRKSRARPRICWLCSGTPKVARASVALVSAGGPAREARGRYSRQLTTTAGARGHPIPRARGPDFPPPRSPAAANLFLLAGWCAARFQAPPRSNVSSSPNLIAIGLHTGPPATGPCNIPAQRVAASTSRSRNLAVVTTKVAEEVCDLLKTRGPPI
jgi:hypothetical protein